MRKLKQCAVLLVLVLASCDDDTGNPPDVRRTTSTNCPVVGTSGNTAIEDGDCTTAGSGTSSGEPIDGGSPVIPTTR